MKLSNLLFIFFFISSDGVEGQLVSVLLDTDESDPVSDLVFLQVSLGQVLQVFTAEFGSRDDDDLGTFFLNLDVFTQVTDSTVNLDVVDQVFGVSRGVKDTVLNWSGGVNDEFLSNGLFLLLERC